MIVCMYVCVKCVCVCVELRRPRAQIIICIWGPFPRISDATTFMATRGHCALPLTLTNVRAKSSPLSTVERLGILNTAILTKNDSKEINSESVRNIQSYF